MSRSIAVASKLFFKDGGSREAFRLFDEYQYKTKSWKQPRKIIVKAERLPDGKNIDGKENTRHIVTNLEGTMQHDSREATEGRGGGQGEYAANFVRAAECISVSLTLAFGLESSFAAVTTQTGLDTNSGIGIKLGTTGNLSLPGKSQKRPWVMSNLR